MKLAISHFAFLLVLVSTIFDESRAKDIIGGPNKSLVLGLTHSRTTMMTTMMTTTTTASISAKSPLEMVDMALPLKGIRDGYIISLNLGTPPQVTPLYLDTGSDLTWVPCATLSFDCIDCDDHRINLLASTFSPSHSSTVLRESCSSPYCMDIHSSDNSFDPCTMAGCSLTMLVRSTCYRPCPSFAYTYGEGVVTGTLARDVLTVDAMSPNKSFTTREIPKFCFGCVGSAYREPIGIAGFGKGPLSLPSQLGFTQKGFSHCFLPFKYANNPNISSPLIVGDLAVSSKEYLQFTPILKTPMYPNYYYIGLVAITVGSIPTTQVPSTLTEFDLSGNGGMIIDSGTTYTHLPYPFYSQLLSLLQSGITHPRATQVEERSGFDLCYRIPCLTNNIMEDDLPLITFHFLNNVSLTLPQGNSFYAMSAPNNSTVVKCLLFQSMEDGVLGPAGVFGSFQQQNVEVVYDLEKGRIGFSAADCAQKAISQGFQKTW